MESSEGLTISVKPSEHHQCPECSLRYRDEEIAKQCAAWCSKHNSCNLEITKLSEEAKARL